MISSTPRTGKAALALLERAKNGDVAARQRLEKAVGVDAGKVQLPAKVVSKITRFLDETEGQFIASGAEARGPNRTPAAADDPSRIGRFTRAAASLAATGDLPAKAKVNLTGESKTTTHPWNEQAFQEKMDALWDKSS